METNVMRKSGALVGSVVLASAALSGVGQVAFALPAAEDAEVPQSAQVAEGATAATDAVRVQAVEGAFAFDQAAVSDNATVSGVFAKAAAALCAELPDYALVCSCGTPIMVTGPNGSTVQATVSDLANGSEEAFVMGCACATNVVGGGAIVNAEVAGASLASILAAMAA